MEKTCKIWYSEQAEKDMKNVYEYIAFEILSPSTAIKYFNNLLDTIDKLKITGKSFAYSQNNFLISTYGVDVRTINYKKMTIVYKIISNNIIILRVMTGSLIKKIITFAENIKILRLCRQKRNI